ncbi:hypothetical protein [Micromonospora sp. NPDC092111]|uniref:hypothetical protein n=1 Tax=Micromonospora sp. NPDC092111 TaxID=3364289 RepID=UPI003808F570
MRQRSDGDDLPKVLRPLPDGRPLLLHVMDCYRRYDLREFVLCVGYGADPIRARVLDAFPPVEPDVADRRDGGPAWHRRVAAGTTITLVDSGVEAEKSRRLLDARPHVGDRPFLLGYGDVLSDIDLDGLIAAGTVAPGVVTVAATRVRSRYGELVVDPGMTVTEFREKPLGEALISAGYFMCGPRLFGLLDPEVALEDDVFPRLARHGEVRAFVHDGHWQPFDTYKDFIEAETLVKEEGYPWLTARRPPSGVLPPGVPDDLVRRGMGG